MNRALITGAAGFVGARLARALRGDGLAVAGLVRPHHDTASLEAVGVTIHRGDAQDAPAVTAAAEGCDVLFHLAAVRGPHKLSPAEYRTQNLRMTEAAIEATLAGPGRRLVAASTAALGRRGTLRQTEATPARPNSGYRTSRVLCERRLRDAAGDGGLEVVVARIPQAVLGPGARAWASRFRALREGRPRLVPRGGTIHSGDVDDVVEALRLCATVPGIGGETFLLGAEREASVRSVLEAAADELGVAYRPRELPGFPFRLYAALGDVAYRLAEVEPPYHYTAEFYAGRFALDIGKARRRLGYAPRHTIEESVRRTVRSLREEGRL